MKRYIPLIAVALIFALIGVFAGRKTLEPTYIDPLSHEVPGWRQMRSVQAEIYDECNVFNNAVNDYDQRVFGVSDYWQDCRINKEGDCEDYALAFRNLLIERFPAIRRYVAVYFVFVMSGGEKVGHAIAIVNHPNGKRYVFDNRFNKLHTLDQVQSHYLELRETEQRGTRYVFVERGNA